MKRAVCAVAFILLSVSPLFAIKTNLIDDVIRMSKSGVAAETIIEYVQASRDQLIVTADDILAMKNAGVSDEVIQAVVDRESPPPQPSSASATPPAGALAPSDAPPQTPTYNGGWCRTFDPPVSLWFPIYGALIPPQLWDPYWYQPRLDMKSGAPAQSGRTARAKEPTAVPVAHEKAIPSIRERTNISPGRQPERSSGRSSPARSR